MPVWQHQQPGAAASLRANAHGGEHEAAAVVAVAVEGVVQVVPSGLGNVTSGGRLSTRSAGAWLTNALVDRYGFVRWH